ncbi:MAG: 4Fe-4S binding protein [Elusimicrobia bacterium]|nr:4Fe-4S binding protein [Elusimicrobiota bacterium]
MKRKIIRIDESKCDGCGLCASACAEGAIRIVDGKARLVSETYCDGLGACLGECPRGALTVEEREALVFDEEAVKEHMKKEQPAGHSHAAPHGGCPSVRMMDFGAAQPAPAGSSAPAQSALSHWPVQLHLISPGAPYFQNADIVLSADCVAYALGGFHENYLKGRKLSIACPKLDSGQEEYEGKVRSLIDDAKINTLTVMIMQVPCCSGLLAMAKRAAQSAKRKVPVKAVVVGLKGEVLSEDWV